ncbi:pilus assembly protein FimV [Pseudomonas duriflava]|uniref:Pilus assembly protein FimV n=1 Tax=Pseudomonas duriflava TaxID=459528 RepID=A0A562Q1A8_9PSED|nr:FimV/HubP family polar landmark protein [Pseudomonas duriflava]TWI50475.1 pilus assembly protein FimV [Pseudomonas duriflava]
MARKNSNRYRFVIAFLALLLGVGTETAYAVALGDISLQSALNQPLNAKIELINAGPLEESDFRVGLASNDEFAQAGVDRTQFLSDLSFTPVIQSGGKSYIRVTSRRPVNEPYLSFLVRFEMPTGRQLREFTVLVDPPGYRDPGMANATSPAVAAFSEPARSTMSGDPVRTRPAVAAPVPRPDLQAGSDVYRTVANDNLWAIAQELTRQSPNLSSVRQTMEDLFALNPTAFVGGDMERLKAGQVLRLPAEFSRLSVPVVSEDHAQDTGTVVGAPSSLGVEGSPETVSAAPASAAPDADVAGERESASLVNNQSLLRMAEMQTQLEQLQARLDQTIREKDAQIAALQSEVAQLQRGGGAGDADPLSGSSDALESSGVASGRQAPSVESSTAVVSPVAQDSVQASKPAEQVDIAPTQSISSAPVTEESQTRKEENISTSFPWLWLIPVAALLVAIVIAWKRRLEEQARELKEDIGGTEYPTLAERQPVAFDEPTLARPVPLAEPAVAATQPPTTSASVPISLAAQAADEYLGRAEIYIAYGRYNQAREVLEEGVLEQPGRLDIRMALLQVLAALGERKLFAVQEAAILEMGGDAHAIDQLKALLPAMAQELPEEKHEEALLDDSFELPDELSEWTPKLDLGADELTPTIADIENFDLDLQDLSFDDAIALTELLDAEQGHEKAKPAQATIEDELPYTLGELPSVDELDMTLDEHFASQSLADSIHDGFADYKDHPLLDQAKTCMEQGNMRAASAILQRILNEGDESQRHQAEVLLARIA